MTVFVSYSSRDRDAVKSLVQDLQDADEQVWMDQRLTGGEAWWRAILEQIRGCDVFIFALSQNSIESKPCGAELHYAQALGLQILPVQVGPVDSIQINPLATVQAIDYRHPTPSTAMRLSAALHRERARRQPLPEPLPDEPPVPFEYLIRLYTTIAGPDQLSPHDQAALVAQIQVGLREDGQHEAARNDIVMLLRKLRDREDVTYRTRTDVEAILASIGTETRPATTAPTLLDEQLPPPPGPTLLDDEVRRMQPLAPDAARQQPADLHLAATPQRQGRQPQPVAEVVRRLKWPLIAAIVLIPAAGITGYALRPHSPASQTQTGQPAPDSGQTLPGAAVPSAALAKGAAPKVVATEPAAGATVPAGPFKLKVTFDQKMVADSYSFMILQGDTYPPCSSRATISADGMSFSLDCTLEAGKSYALGFNGGSYMNFKNEAGVAAVPSELHFSTAP